MRPMPGVPERNANRVLARLGGVQGRLDRVAGELEGRAEARFAPHRRTGAHGFSVRRGKVDRLVCFEGPGAVAVEMGHINERTGGYVEGLAVLRGALRDMGGA